MEKSKLDVRLVLALRFFAAILLGMIFFAYTLKNPPFDITAATDITATAGLFTLIYIAVISVFASDKKADVASLLFIAAATAALLYLRVSMLGYPSGDYRNFLTPWIEEMKALSVKEALVTKIGDYNMPYLYFLLFVSRRTASPIIWIKWLSCIFDFVAAYFVMKIVSLKTENRAARYFAFVLTAALPTVLLNSAYWGQCDSIVTALAVASLYFVLENKGIGAVVCFTLAFSVKLQAVFVLPALVICFFAKKIMLWHAVLFPITFFATLLPAMVAGRSLIDCVRIYFDQTGQYPYLTLNAPSVWQLFGNFNFDYFSKVGVMLGGIGAVALIYIGFIYKDRLSEASVIELFYISALLIPFLLPRMHERYFYTADILSVLVFFYDKKRWYLPLITVVASLNAYLAYLADKTLFPQSYAAVALLILIILSAKNLFQRMKTDEA